MKLTLEENKLSAQLVVFSSNIGLQNSSAIKKRIMDTLPIFY